jgi:hypothetical protein
VRTKTIIAGAIAALALATLSANAGNAATHQVPGSVVSLVAATTAVAKADRDAEAAQTRSVAHEQTTEAVAKPVAAVKPAVPKVIQTTPACQQAINTLKLMYQADVTEDAAERTAEQALSATALAADQAEDTAEAQHWRTALLVARSVCLPQPSAGCEAAIAGVQALLQANRTEGLGEQRDVRNVNWPVQLAGLRSAFGTVAIACGHRD